MDLLSVHFCHWKLKRDNTTPIATELSVLKTNQSASKFYLIALPVAFLVSK